MSGVYRLPAGAGGVSSGRADHQNPSIGPAGGGGAVCFGRPADRIGVTPAHVARATVRRHPASVYVVTAADRIQTTLERTRAPRPLRARCERRLPADARRHRQRGVALPQKFGSHFESDC